MNQEPTGAMLFTSYLPLILVMLVFGLFAFFLAKRKGASVPLYCLLAVIPGVQLFALIILASKTDKAILERLEALETASKF